MFSYDQTCERNVKTLMSIIRGREILLLMLKPVQMLKAPEVKHANKQHS